MLAKTLKAGAVAAVFALSLTACQTLEGQQKEKDAEAAAQPEAQKKTAAKQKKAAPKRKAPASAARKAKKDETAAPYAAKAAPAGGEDKREAAPKLDPKKYKTGQESIQTDDVYKYIR